MAAEQDAAAQTGGSDSLNCLNSYTTRWDTIRAAFRDVVPAEILARAQKGQSTMSLLDCLHRSGAFVRELLMDGILAREKILDRVAVEPYLKHARPMDVSHLFPLSSCIAVELWARSWAIARRL